MPQNMQNASFDYMLISQLRDVIEKNWKDLHVHKDVGKHYICISLVVWHEQYVFLWGNRTRTLKVSVSQDMF